MTQELVTDTSVHESIQLYMYLQDNGSATVVAVVQVLIFTLT